MPNVTTIRPGIMVALRTSIKGNVSYNVTHRGTTRTVEGDVTEWDTTRLVREPQEQERASKARSLARSAIQTVCAHSDFCLLCPLDKEAKLDEAVEKAMVIVEEFNRSSDITTLSFNVLRGRIEADDVRAMKAINREMRDLIDTMATGMANLDVGVIRDAANKAKSVSQMLVPEAQERVQAAIDLARKAARQISKAGEQAAAEVDRVAIQRLTEARTAFLDLEPQGEVLAPEISAPAVDLGPAQYDAAVIEPEKKALNQEYERFLDNRARIDLIDL
jgi:hypothetical protein